MKFKPGDIVVHKDEDKCSNIYLILEVNLKEEDDYKIFFLSAFFKENIGTIVPAWFGKTFYCRLQDRKL